MPAEDSQELDAEAPNFMSWPGFAAGVADPVATRVEAFHAATLRAVDATQLVYTPAEKLHPVAVASLAAVACSLKNQDLSLQAFDQAFLLFGTDIQLICQFN